MIGTDIADTQGSGIPASTMLDRWALARIQAMVSAAPIRFLLWDGYQLESTAGAPCASIVFRTRSALLSWVWNAALDFGETYRSGSMEIRGDLVALLEAIYRVVPASPARAWWWPQRGNGTRAARDNVHHHYDLGNAFYRL